MSYFKDCTNATLARLGDRINSLEENRGNDLHVIYQKFDALAKALGYEIKIVPFHYEAVKIKKESK